MALAFLKMEQCCSGVVTLLGKSGSTYSDCTFIQYNISKMFDRTIITRYYWNDPMIHEKLRATKAKAAEEMHD
jgi:hypothetical protein